MTNATSIVCPIDCSRFSGGALHYALAIARRFDASLTVMTVDDPLLTELADTRFGADWLRHDSEAQLRALVAAAERGFDAVDVVYKVRSGKAAPAIIDTAHQRGCQLIVMGTHCGGVRKQLFGATARRLLRATPVPILLTSADPGPLSFEQLAAIANPVLVPVDFSSATAHQVDVAGWIAEALHLRVLLGDVIEAIQLPAPEAIDTNEIMSERHRRACQGLQLIALGGRLRVAPEILIASGRPAHEIALGRMTIAPVFL